MSFSRIRWISEVGIRLIRSRRESDRNTASRLSIAGIAVGVMALVAVLSVMNGFQLGTIEAMLEVNSYHLRIRGEAAEDIDGDDIDTIREIDGVRAVVPFSETETIARGFFETTRGAVVRSVPPDVLDRDPGMARTLDRVDGRLDFEESGTIMLGAELRRELGVRVGDTVSFVTLAPRSRGDDRSSRVPREAHLTVSGSFRTGFFQYDSGWAFVSEQTAAETFGAGAGEQVVGIKLEDRFADGSQRQRVAAELGIDSEQVASWREYNRAIFGALRTEKVTMSVLLALIFVVVAANIYQSLRRSVHDRAEEISILKALGARPGDIQLVFVFEGLVIGFVGAFVGLSVGLLVAANVNAIFAGAELVANSVLDLAATLIGPIAGGGGVELFSPQIFYMTEVPVAIVFGEVVAIVFFAVAASAAAAWLASTRAAGVRPAEVLRNE
ncbi:MAG: ABC transporter permease [Spirochaetales bacterium]